MAPPDPGGLLYRPLFPSKPGTTSHTAIPSNNTVADRRSIASLNTSTSPSQSQNTSSPWLYSSQPSPSTLPSPSSNQHNPLAVPQSNHPSPATSVHSPPPPNMIGTTPAFYDPDHEIQPQAQDYQQWIDTSYNQNQLVYTDTSSYALQPSTVDNRTERQMQEPRHSNYYQFVPSQHPPPPPPPPSADATHAYGYFPHLQNRPFDGGRPPPSHRQSRTPQTTSSQNWQQQSGTNFRQSPSTTDDTFSAYPGIIAARSEYPGVPDTHGPVQQQQQQQHQHQLQHQQQHQHQFPSPAEHLTPSLVLTPASDVTLPSAQSISPAMADNQPLPSLGTGSCNTPTSTVAFQASPKQVDMRMPVKAKPRKRQKSETETDDDEEAVDANFSANTLRTNRLPGACTYCKRLKMKCSFPPGENVCKRCRSGKHDCIVEGRKPRSAPNKREYLLAQVKQKDAIIESLLKQLHNPYLATPLSIEAYRLATPSSDHHRQDVIAWLDRLQSSVRSPPVRSGPAKNPFQLDTRAGTSGVKEGGAESDESDEEQTQQQQQQQRAQPRRASPGSDDTPISPNTLVESDLDPYPDDAVPIGLLANLAISTLKDGPGVPADKTREENQNADDDVGVASKMFFMPGPSRDLELRKSLIDKTSPPDILVHKLVTPEDVEKLFEIFYTRINPFISLLEPKLHTPALTFSRCPFLFTVVCAIASRYSDKPEVYPIAMHFAKSAAANALIDGWKSVELCQAYILMSIYAVPARRWEEDRSWLYTGLAIRIATDLNLHVLPPKKPSTEQQELEMLNRTRIWIICFNLDKSTATQFGKPSTLKEDYIMRNSLEWYKSSKYNHPYDVHIIAYSSLFRIVNKFHQEVFSDPTVPSGLNRSIDFRAVTLEYDRLLTIYREEWIERFARDSDRNDAACEFRAKLLPFYTNYARLVMFSFGFQKAFQRGLQAEDEVFFTRSLESAKTVVTVLVDSLVPTGYIRFAPDGYFVFAAFASAFMLKLLRPECSRFITQGLESETYQVIERLISTIGSPQIAIDERHTPKLYSRFLASLLTKHKRDGAARGRMHQQGPPTQQSQTSSSAPAYHQQQVPPSHSASPPFAAGGSRANVQDVPQTMTSNSEASTPSGYTEVGTANANANEPIYQVDAPSYTFGTQSQPDDGDIMDFTFDPIANPSSEDLLAAMKAIQNPMWWQTMMMPGFSWPTEEPMPDQPVFFNNGLTVDNYQNFHPLPAEVHLS